MLYQFKLIFRNLFRHKLRTALTLAGMVVAIVAFGLLQTVVTAWYNNAEMASATRLVTRNAISLVFPLPLSYRQKLRAIDGVRAVAYANWFGAIYKEPKNFFPQFAIDDAYLSLFPEFVISEAERRDFQRDRKGCVVGRKLADIHGFKLGENVTLKGTIFPGDWTFVVRGIYNGASNRTDLSQMFFHWDYLNETVRKRYARRADQVGFYVIEAAHADDMARIAIEVDNQFRNSTAETLTETEKAFQLGFVSMTEAIVVAIRLVSYLVIFIIMAVMANTMAMTARERLGEYATLKALGFGPGFLAATILGESLLLAGLGGAASIALTFPVAAEFSKHTGTLFPVFQVAPHTVLLQCACAAAIGLLAALLPMRRAMTVNIVAGLRSIG
ncbi:MAG: ABC transporter permease [Proteobacteria bacterium]|nr:ABC transporter permease [Pseudomonadota bacterium]